MGWNLVGNALIGQSGGPTAVINQSLVGAILEAKRNRKHITGFLGALHGVRGILDERFIDLYAQRAKTLKDVAATPSAALGSVRHKPSEKECRRIFQICQDRDIRYFFYIGGNDSAETAHLINRLGRRASYELRMIHIPKTIDNDLRITDHCPGYGSAARFVAQAFIGDDLDNRSMHGIKINIVMGRHAGFLTAASALGRREKDDGPHLIYVPEIPLDEKQFLLDVERVYKRLGRCVIAVSEGVHDKRGELLAKKFLKEIDAHGNIQLSGSGALGDHLCSVAREHLAKITGESVRVRADTFGYLQRSYPGVISEVDSQEAHGAGRAAVRFALEGDVDGSVVIRRKPTDTYETDFDLVPLGQLAKHTKSMPRKFMNRAGNNVTQAFIDYARPLLGKMPIVGRLEHIDP